MDNRVIELAEAMAKEFNDGSVFFWELTRSSRDRWIRMAELAIHQLKVDELEQALKDIRDSFKRS